MPPKLQGTRADVNDMATKEERRKARTITQATDIETAQRRRRGEFVSDLRNPSGQGFTQRTGRAGGVDIKVDVRKDLEDVRRGAGIGKRRPKRR